MTKDEQLEKLRAFANDVLSICEYCEINNNYYSRPEKYSSVLALVVDTIYSTAESLNFIQSVKGYSPGFGRLVYKTPLLTGEKTEKKHAKAD